jgi:hypothetical protein
MILEKSPQDHFDSSLRYDQCPGGFMCDVTGGVKVHFNDVKHEHGWKRANGRNELRVYNRFLD